MQSLNENVHIHVGHNIPGYIPESDVMCFASVDNATWALRHEIADQQDFYYDGCGNGAPEGCECDWCSVAGDCGAALSSIADGDASHRAENSLGTMFIFSPPSGPDIVHWLTFADGDPKDCEDL